MEDSIPFIVFAVVVLAFAVLFLKAGIKIISQSDIYIVERLGKFHKVLDGGFHIIIPFVDQIRAVITVREQLVDITKQQVITKDNVNISVDGIVFLKVVDGKMALYNVDSYKRAIANLAMTTLRGEIGAAQNGIISGINASLTKNVALRQSESQLQNNDIAKNISAFKQNDLQANAAILAQAHNTASLQSQFNRLLG